MGTFDVGLLDRWSTQRSFVHLDPRERHKRVKVSKKRFGPADPKSAWRQRHLVSAARQLCSTPVDMTQEVPDRSDSSPTKAHHFSSGRQAKVGLIPAIYLTDSKPADLGVLPCHSNTARLAKQ